MTEVALVNRQRLGQCVVDLLRVVDGSEQQWMVFFQSPRGARVDTLSRVLRQAGGHFGNLGGHLGLVYDGPQDAQAAFDVLLATVAREAGGIPQVLN